MVTSVGAELANGGSSLAQSQPPVPSYLLTGKVALVTGSGLLTPAKSQEEFS